MKIKNTIKNYLGKKVTFNHITVKDTKGWKATEAHKTSNVKYYISNEKGIIVAVLKKNDVFVLWKDSSTYPADGWSPEKAIRYAYLKTQSIKSNES